jgi:ribosomal protein L37AE/L43A
MSDPHASIASRVFHVSPEDVTPGQRRIAKTINFGVMYAASPSRISQRFNIKLEEVPMDCPYDDNEMVYHPSDEEGEGVYECPACGYSIDEHGKLIKQSEDQER